MTREKALEVARGRLVNLVELLTTPEIDLPVADALLDNAAKWAQIIQALRVVPVEVAR